MFRQVIKCKYLQTSHKSCFVVDRNKVSGLGPERCINQKGFYSSGSNSIAKKFKKAIYMAGGIIIGGGSLFLYAKYDEDFQIWSKNNVPGYESIATTLSKNDNIFQVYISDPVVTLKDSLIDSVTSLVGTNEAEPNKDKPYSKQAKVNTQISTEKTETHTSKPLTTIIELEKRITSQVQECTQSYSALSQVIRDYTDEVQRLVDHSFQQIDSRVLSAITKKHQKKEKELQTVEAKIDAAMQLVDKMTSLLQDSTIASDVKQRLTKNTNKALSDVQAIKKKVENEVANINVTDKFWREVQQARKYFFNELDNLVENKDIYDPNLRLSDEELNIFLTYAYQKILFYQRELSKVQSSNEQQIQQALKELKENEQIVNASVQVQLDKERLKIQEEYAKKGLALLLAAKRNTKAHIKYLTEAHQDIVKEAIATKEEEMKRKFERELDSKIDEVKAEGEMTIAGMVGKLIGYNDAIKQRILEREKTKEIHELWFVCQSLKHCLDLPHTLKPSEDELQPLMKHVVHVVEISGGDEFVKTVVATIPKIALDRGVYPEMSLKDRFFKVERVAGKLDQIDDFDVSMPKLLISWMRNFLMFRNVDRISSSEAMYEPVDISKLSTHDILHRSRLCVNSGNLLQALKYMQLLEGAPREVAEDWIKEVIIFLETSQATEALLAHALGKSFSQSL
uniref:MICOS complex subunit MIC60 n=1 Tax=Clastoptera arizonana TaxID=38151 RepID=A0A1B6EGU1_9HEMI